jgi:RNA polymerase sigma-70 factor (ECF subfamily)
LKPNETALLDRAKAGDKSAMSELIHSHTHSVYNVGLRILQDPMEAEDVLQETFLQFMHSLNSFRGDSSLGTWLYRVATNKALEKIRKKNKAGVQVELEDLDDEPLKGSDIRSWPEDVAQLWKENSVQSCLKEALASLPDGNRSVFILRDLEGYSTKETAEALNLSVANVKIKLMRARLFLRDKMAHNLHCVEANS